MKLFMTISSKEQICVENDNKIRKFNTPLSRFSCVIPFNICLFFTSIILGITLTLVTRMELIVKKRKQELLEIADAS
ncbi:hypothetical protein SNEBB_001431 [Seison nebaliae]|nr:hypothetical protein SNEBB_001431 [Seison nebaliae]